MKFLLLISLLVSMTYTMRITRDDSSLNDDDFETEELELGKVEVNKNFSADPEKKPENQASIKDTPKRQDAQETPKTESATVTATPAKPSTPQADKPSDEKKNNSNIKYEGMVIVPSSQEPQFYNPPPNIKNEKTLMKIVDVFNPSQLPELTPAYPEYDVLPEVDHFWQSFTPIVKDKKKIESVDVIKGYNKALRSYKKEVFQNENQSTAEIRKERKIYDANWLAKQLKISRIVYLEDMLSKNKNKK